jgi:spoIIIJ-associated protein
MSRSIEVQGVTVDEAIQQALNDLGVGRDNVEIKILHHPRSGFLGIGARRAKVRATLREQVMKDGEEFDMSPAERQSRGRRRRRPRRRAGEDDRGAQSGAKQGDSRGQGRKQDAQNQRDGKGGRGQGRRGEGRSRRDSRDSSGGDDRGQAGGRNGRDGGEKQESAEGRSGDGQQKKRERGRDGQRGRGGRGRRDRGPKEAGGRNAGAKSEAPETPSQQQPEQQKAPQQAPAPPERERSAASDRQAVPAAESRREPAEALDSEVVLSRARELVDELARRMGFEAEIGGHLDTEAEEAVVEVKADAEGLLIGRRGQTLDALEHVVNRMVVGHNQTADVRVAIDVGGYRERRRESLVELAERLRERAVAEGRRVQVSPMSARDRRIFQQALAEDGTVETRVLGSGFYRRLLVVPAGADADSSASDAVADFEPEDGGSDTGGAEVEKPAESDASESERDGDATG